MLKRVVHPGEILSDELTEFGITPTAFARQINVPPNRISQIIAGRRSVTGDTALRFGHWFGVDPQFWLNLQTQFDLAIADQQPCASVPGKGKPWLKRFKPIRLAIALFSRGVALPTESWRCSGFPDRP